MTDFKMVRTITFENIRQAAIFEYEIKGQISDGAWENSRNTDWEKWYDTEVLVGSDVGRNFNPKRTRFNIVEELLDCVGDRMRGYALAAVKYGFSEANIMGNYAVIDDRTGDWILPTYKGKYYDYMRTVICSHDPKEFAAYMAAAELLYTDKELEADLRAIEKAMRKNVNE